MYIFFLNIYQIELYVAGNKHKSHFTTNIAKTLKYNPL